MPPTDDPDAGLMTLAARGDGDAFCKLVRKHGPGLVSFFSATGAGAEAEDLAQQTFLKIYGMRRRYRPSAKFSTFLYLVARQTLVDFLRSRGRRDGLCQRIGAEMGGEVEEAPAARGETGDAQRALAALSQPLREAVVLVVMQGFEYHEAAEALGVPVGTVKSRVHDALRRMRLTLSK